MGTAIKDLRFSSESLALLDQVEKRLWELLRNKAIDKVSREGRDLVTGEDVMACLDEALREVRETGLSHAGR